MAVRTASRKAGRSAPRTLLAGARAAGAALLLLLASLAPASARFNPMTGTHSTDMCSRGNMSGARAYRNLAAQERCTGPCVAVGWVAPVTEAPCVVGYTVELENAEDGTKVTRRARSTESGVIISGPMVKSVAPYKVTLTTKYSPSGSDTTSFNAVSSSA